MRNLVRFTMVAALLALALSGVPFGPKNAEASICPSGGRCSADCRSCSTDSNCRVIMGESQACVCGHICL
jgi:hypothetical protein